MGSAFSTKTVFQFVATLESVFATVILGFAVKALVLYQDYVDTDPRYQNQGRQYIQYSAFAACGQAVIQIIAAIILVIKSKYSADKHGKNIHPGLVPKLWMFHSLIQFALQLCIVLTPMLLYGTEETEPQDKDGKDGKTLSQMQKTLREFYTYELVSAIFKLFFIWGVSSTLNGPKHDSQDGPLVTKDMEKSEHY